jgi:hypothetical protein
MFSSYSDNISTLGTYATEDDVTKELAKIKEKFLSNGPGFITEDHEDGHGFSYGHEMGSMSFEPGAYLYKEQEVIE